MAEIKSESVADFIPESVADLLRNQHAGRGEPVGDDALRQTLITTAKLNDIDPQVWLADVLHRITDHPASRLHELLPWNWEKLSPQAAAA